MKEGERAARACTSRLNDFTVEALVPLHCGVPRRAHAAHGVGQVRQLVHFGDVEGRGLERAQGVDAAKNARAQLQLHTQQLVGYRKRVHGEMVVEGHVLEHRNDVAKLPGVGNNVQR
jgi:hypothetical protein